eukprot:2212700-Pyramimonas_sp.AAC.1
MDVATSETLRSASVCLQPRPVGSEGREEGVRGLPRPAPPAPPAPPTTATTSIRFWRKRPVHDEAWVRRLALHDDEQNKTAIGWREI